MRITIPQPKSKWTLTSWGVQGVVAKRTGISAPIINMIWTGKRPASPANAAKLEAEFLRLGIDINRYDLVWGIKPGQSLPDYYKEKMGKGQD